MRQATSTGRSSIVLSARLLLLLVDQLWRPKPLETPPQDVLVLKPMTNLISQITWFGSRGFQSGWKARSRQSRYADMVAKKATRGRNVPMSTEIVYELNYYPNKCWWEDCPTLKKLPFKRDVGHVARSTNSLTSRIAPPTYWNNNINVITDGQKSDIEIYNSRGINRCTHPCLSSSPKLNVIPRWLCYNLT